MSECGPYDIGADHSLAIAFLMSDGIRLNLGQAALNRSGVGINEAMITTHERLDAQGFGRTPYTIPARCVLAVMHRRRHKHGASMRMNALQKSGEIFAAYDAGEPQVGRSFSYPLPHRL